MLGEGVQPTTSNQVAHGCNDQGCHLLVRPSPPALPDCCRRRRRRPRPRPPLPRRPRCRRRGGRGGRRRGGGRGRRGPRERRGSRREEGLRRSRPPKPAEELQQAGSQRLEQRGVPDVELPVEGAESADLGRAQIEGTFGEAWSRDHEDIGPLGIVLTYPMQRTDLEEPHQRQGVEGRDQAVRPEERRSKECGGAWRAGAGEGATKLDQLRGLPTVQPPQHMPLATLEGRTLPKSALPDFCEERPRGLLHLAIPRRCLVSLHQATRCPSSALGAPSAQDLVRPAGCRSRRHGDR
mmetsp:Transcript_65921/g.189680  ORF Transcript_65921/g.189680 Transcript_65921/m.189680 type:complete len:294 (+) Transcript_65921:946-1827(+)